MPCHPSEPEFQVRDIPNLRGYVVIVTGGNSGIGYETTLQLALRGARVYIASRSSDRVNKAIAELRQNSPDLDLHFLKLDLQDIQTIKETAADFMSRESRLDILINNAGIMASPWQLTKDGHEVQWQTCFLSHHALTMELMPLLVAAAQASGRMDRARIVNVASDMALGMGPATINYEDPNLTNETGRLAPWKRYGHCKEANIIAARAITDRYQALGVTAYSLHPGIVKTGLQSHNPSKVFQMVSRVAMSVGATGSTLEASMNTLFCATSGRAFANPGRYYVPVTKLDHRANKWLDDPQAVNKLWDLATRQLKEHGFHFEDIPRYYH
ncbi:reductase [Fusarium heterosporum]|uniref:Reductase n=1 Tax=Fusarium heterosporum TaxID=42747 RepID=A0A8H5WJ57_FUSHE|nr:reductase [Fusarium heterosporum]